MRQIMSSLSVCLSVCPRSHGRNF